MATERELSEVAETYLETVYQLRETDGSARTGAIADALGVTAGSVSPTMASLQRRGLVRRREGHRGFELTPKGERVVMQILRKRRLAERLLTDMLGMKWTEVHTTAARFAHGITAELADLLERKLKNPATCPHGNPIPNSSGSIKQSKTEFLGELGSGQEATLASVTMNKKDLLRYLERVGLVPGASVRVEEKCPFDGALIVNISGTRVPVGKYVASSIRITRNNARE